MKKDLITRLNEGPIMCAEGYLFAMERRGYLSAGPFVPEVVLEHPEVVTQLHREFIRAGSDVVQAFTYYGHREKLRIIGKEHLLEPMQKNALKIAKDAAAEFKDLDLMVCGDVANTNVFDPNREDTAPKKVLTQDQFNNLSRAAIELEGLPLFIDDTPGLTIGALRTRARRLQRQHGLGLVIIDYLQLLRGTGTKGKGVENRVQEVSEITRGLKALAKELKIPVVALSQLSRAIESRENKRPLLSDLRESGTIEQDADMVTFVYRPEYYHEQQQPDPGTAEHMDWLAEGEKLLGMAEFIIGKQRHGPTGIINLKFEAEITKFSDLPVDDEHMPEQHF